MASRGFFVLAVLVSVSAYAIFVSRKSVSSTGELNIVDLGYAKYRASYFNVSIAPSEEEEEEREVDDADNLKLGNGPVLQFLEHPLRSSTTRLTPLSTSSRTFNQSQCYPGRRIW
jgi:hypothetical protein